MTTRRGFLATIGAAVPLVSVERGLETTTSNDDSSHLYDVTFPSHTHDISITETVQTGIVDYPDHNHTIGGKYHE